MDARGVREAVDATQAGLWEAKTVDCSAAQNGRPRKGPVCTTANGKALDVAARNWSTKQVDGCTSIEDVFKE